MLSDFFLRDTSGQYGGPADDKAFGTGQWPSFKEWTKGPGMRAEYLPYPVLLSVVIY